MSISGWGDLGAVDVRPLAQWLATVKPGWPPVKGGQPNRVSMPHAARPIVADVLTRFAESVECLEHSACLSRLVPGSTYEYHRDPQPQRWLTRVHVPVVTNPGAWLMFAADGVPVHFAVGRAYSFDMAQPHRYGNDGPTDRIHLLFDVLRGA